MVAFGTAAAVASVYQAPLAGAFFALEIVFGVKAVGREAFIQVPALLVASGAGALMSSLFLGSKPLFAMTKPIEFTWHDGLPIAIGAILAGALGPAYFRMIEGLRFLKKWTLALLWSAVVVGLFSCVRPETWGNGDSGVLEVMHGLVPLQVATLILVLRLGATAACVGSGVVGGVFTPTVFAGSVLGLLYGNLILSIFGHHFAAPGYAVLGIACLLASVTHAPVMAALMTVELTGSWPWLPVFLLCSLVSFWIARRISPDSLYAVATPDPGKRARNNAQGQNRS